MAKVSRLWSAFVGSLWAIEESKLKAVEQVLRHRLQEGRAEDFDVASRGSKKTVNVVGQIAVIPIFGVIGHRMDLFSEISGGTSVQSLRNNFRDAMADDDVGGILFDVDSPGGAIDGIPELADEIFAARSKKPIFAIANTRAASGALWFAVAAEQFFVTKSGQVGSIGVYAVHEDRTAQNEKEGIKVTYIASSAEKVETNPDVPLSDDALRYATAQVNEMAAMFRKFVAKARGVGVDNVVEKFGNGRMLLATAAKSAGLVDRIATFDQVVNLLGQRVNEDSKGKSQTGAVVDEIYVHRTTALTDAMRAQEGDADVPVSGEETTDATPAAAPAESESAKEPETEPEPAAAHADLDALDLTLAGI